MSDDLLKPRPFHEWHEDIRDVLWWKFPIEDAPYCGSPLDLGYTVEVDLSIATSQRNADRPEDTKVRMQVGGWPFDEEDEPWLWWTPLPDADVLDEHIRDDIRGGPDPMKDTHHDD